MPWLLLLALAVALLARQARGLDWPAVADALRGQAGWRLAVAVALAAASYLVYASYDLVGRRVTGHPLTTGRTLGIAAMSYAGNLNLGSLLGGVALRLRLYTRWGLDVPTAGRIVVLAMLTNWSGYLLVAGSVLVLQPPPLPEGWPVGPAAMRAVGASMVALALGYAALCAGSSGRRIRVRGHALELPSGRVALLQLALSSLNWALIGTLVWWLLQQRVDYVLVLSVLLLAAVAGVVTHVPAGLGVLEAVFIATLGGRVPTPTLVAALLAYRACYYLLPFAIALPALLASEWAARRRGAPAPPEPGRGAAPATDAQAPGPQSMQRSTGGGPMRSAR